MKMEEQKQTVERKNTPWLTLWGALGFGIGGAIGGILLALEEPILGFSIFGTIGGASLGFALEGWKKAGILALACAIGLGVGFMMAFFITLAIWVPPGYVEGLFRGAVGGAFGGASLGLASKDRRGVWILALAGAVGFGIAAQFDWDLLQALRVSDATVLGFAMKLAIWGIFGGAFLGTALGFLERRRARQQSEHNQ